MKRILFMLLSVLVLCACENKEGWLSKNPTKYDEYKFAFEKKYGPIDPNQSWDFYQIATENTRGASSGISIIPCDQPIGVDFSKWQTMLVGGKDNSLVGTHDYSLISNGDFFAYAVWYGGWYPVYKKYDFELGISYDNHNYKMFSSAGVTTKEVSDGYQVNPGFGAEIGLAKGEKFQFYIKYKVNNKTYTKYSNMNDCSTLLYSNNNTMVIGFEDGGDKDFCDIILYLKGNKELPIPESKRFLAEDLGAIGDFDFNDVVFDVKPNGAGKADVIIQAAGGVFPTTLVVAGNSIGELHELLGVSSSDIVNTGYKDVNPFITTIDVPSDFDLNTFNDIKLIVSDSIEITLGKNGESPAMIAVPINTRWPKEKVSIEDAYPDFFKVNWWNNVNLDKVY